MRYDVTVDSTYVFLKSLLMFILFVFFLLPLSCCLLLTPIGFILIIVLLTSFSNIKEKINTTFSYNSKTLIVGDEVTIINIFDKSKTLSLSDIEFVYDIKKDMIKCKTNKSVRLASYTSECFGFESFKQYLIDRDLLVIPSQVL